MDVTTNEIRPEVGISIGGFGFRRVALVTLLAFVAGSLALYWNALSFEFLNYDDAFYVRDNANLAGGFSWHSIRWALEANLLTVDRSAEYWMPITLLSRLLDAQLFGANGGWHHLQNIVIHGCNAWLVFLILTRLTGAAARSALVGALFLVHPINAEVVCWIALRKDVLAGATSLLTILLYVHYVRKPTFPRYLGVLFCFAGALLCKPSVVSLPLALLLIDWWPLGRIAVSFRLNRPAIVSNLTVVAEKIPFLIMALLASFVSLVGQQQMGTGDIGGEQTLQIGFGRTVVGYVDYLRRIFLLDSFCVLYPNRPWSTIAAADIWGAGALVGGITLGTIALAVRKYRPPLMGWVWFIGLLLPVSGFVQFGRQATADRYVYVPIIGLFIFVVWILSDLLGHFKTSAPTARVRWLVLGTVAVAVALVGFLAVEARRQSLTWRNDQALWTQAMTVEPDAVVAFNNFGAALTRTGEYKAEENYRRAALKMVPESVEQMGNLGKCLAWYGNVDAAVALLEKALKLDPFDMERHRALIFAYRRDGRIAEANSALARYELTRGRVFLSTGLDYLRRGDTDLARAQFSLAFTALLRARKSSGVDLELSPPVNWLNRARDWFIRLPAIPTSSEDRLLIQSYLSYLAGDVRSAAHLFGVAVEKWPQSAEAHWRRAICLAGLGQNEAADLEAAAARDSRVTFDEGSSDWLFLRGEKDGAPVVSP